MNQGYLIVRTKDGQYVAKSGHSRSYTRDLRNARLFNSREYAERNVCPENEFIVSVESQLSPPSASTGA